MLLCNVCVISSSFWDIWNIVIETIFISLSISIFFVISVSILIDWYYFSSLGQFPHTNVLTRRHEEMLCISLKCSLCAALFSLVLCFINFCCLWHFWTPISIPHLMGTAGLHSYAPPCTMAPKLSLSSRWQS